MMQNPLAMYRAVEAARRATQRGVEMHLAVRAAAALFDIQELDLRTVCRLVERAEENCQHARQESNHERNRSYA